MTDARSPPPHPAPPLDGPAGTAFRTLAGVLAAGAEASGPFAQAELLRSIHACRNEGLHRLAAAETRALRSIRELRADLPEFALAALTADLREALAVAYALAGGADDPALLGTARREYVPIGSLRLSGVHTEAVVARSGHAGAITYLADEGGALYTRADVLPGDADRAAAAYGAPVRLGDALLPHRELARCVLLVEAGTASADGRLGTGKRVRAVSAGEPSRWDDGPIGARFRAPFAEQLARIAAHDAEPAEARPAGWDLVFLEGVLAGGASGLGLAVPRGPRAGAGDVLLRLHTAQHDGLPGRHNLVVLSRATGIRVRAIGRVRIGTPRRLHLLAIGPAPGESRFALPEAWRGRANVHYDRIKALAFPDRRAPAAAAAAAAPPPHSDDLLAPLRRRVERAVLGGAGTLPGHALPELEREAAALAAHALPGAAEVLRDLAAAALDTGRDVAGARRPPDPAVFAGAWLRAALYEDAARRRLAIASW